MWFPDPYSTLLLSTIVSPERKRKKEKVKVNFAVNV